jgi:flagellar biosynthesis/type III secretory pathway protein FliH
MEKPCLKSKTKQTNKQKNKTKKRNETKRKEKKREREREREEGRKEGRKDGRKAGRPQSKHLSLYPQVSIDVTLQQRNFSLQRMKDITENRNRTRGREQVIMWYTAPVGPLPSPQHILCT